MKQTPYCILLTVYPKDSYQLLFEKNLSHIPYEIWLPFLTGCLEKEGQLPFEDGSEYLLTPQVIESFKEFWNLYVDIQYLPDILEYYIGLFGFVPDSNAQFYEGPPPWSKRWVL